MWDVIVVGAGPGGLQTAIAAASEGLKTLVLERGNVGGQIGQTPKLENSVFAKGGITGPEFAAMMRDQALAMGAEIQQGECLKLHPAEAGKPHTLRVKFAAGADRPIWGYSVVLAMGNKWTELSIPGVREHVNDFVHMGPVKSIDYRADGGDAAVYGGGPSAGQAVLALADNGSVYRVHHVMRSGFRMPDYLEQRIRTHSKVEILEHHSIVSVGYGPYGEDPQIMVQSEMGHTPENPVTVKALFMCNGLKPATDWLKGTLPLTESGHVMVEELATVLPGIYAIGDCRTGSTPRVGVAIGDGSMAVTKLWEYFQDYPECAICSRIFGK